MTLRMLFPLLPKSEEIRWGEEQLRRGDKWQCVLDDRESEGELRVVSATCTGPVERVMDGNMNYTWRFDEQGGRVDTIKMIATWGGYNEKIELTGRLQETKQRTREWLAALQDDMSLYFDVKQRFQGMKGGSVARCAEIQGDGSAGMEPLLNKIGQELRQARQLVSTTVMQKQIDSDLERNAREIKMIESREKRINEFASLIGSPSPDWESTDLEDSPVALRDYRGQVVVLDFWFRECAYCLRMMPQIQQVEKDFADQPVTFLGMSVDDEVEDARFVVQQMDVTQRVVVAQKIHPLYKTTSAPLLVVIGPQGDVRDIFVGYRSTIQEELTEVIREALHNQPPSTISK